MNINHNPHSFLTGDDPFLPTVPIDCDDGSVIEKLTFTPRHEGFIGIPHGGLAMGLCLDAWRRTSAPEYPAAVRFRFGGSGIVIGDTAIFEVEDGRDEKGRRVIAKITGNGDKTPYLRAEIRPAERSGLSADIGKPPPGEDFRKLPYYRNCFVCGHHRIEPGLQRRFRLHEAPDEVLITAKWGFEGDDEDRTNYFLFGTEELHPAVLTSIFDENTAWAGFMLTRSAGLSVRVELTLIRPVAKNEKLLFVGKPAGIRGNPRSPRFFLGEGTIFSMSDPQRPEIVAYGKGEWVVLDQYTQQIKQSLLPEDDWEWIFG
jgi:hypothetical protein